MAGWGRAEWGIGPWGEPASVPVSVNLTGFSLTSALGSITLVTNNNLSVTGLSATGAVSGVGVNGQAVATLPSIVSSVGTPTVIADAEANVFPAGQAGTSALGTIAVVAEANVTLTAFSLLQLLEL
jgi:hypothetical protein